MFREWGFLLGEMWILIILAALLGLLAGWIIWGRRSEVTINSSEADQLRADLEACRAKHAEKDFEISELRGQKPVAVTPAPVAAPVEPVAEVEADAPVETATLEEEAAPSEDAASVEATTQDDAAADVDADLGGDLEGDFDGDGVVEGKNEGVKPTTLDAPREGGADDLKKIKGVGPKMEKLCNSLGFWHFDQIAKWTDAEIAWVDANLEGFSGRVRRDSWVEQAGLLADGGTTEFSKKVDKGGVY